MLNCGFNNALLTSKPIIGFWSLYRLWSFDCISLTTLAFGVEGIETLTSSGQHFVNINICSYILSETKTR